MEDILLNHSQLAAVVAGFASVVVAFQRPLSPVQRHRFLTILFTSLLQIIGCLVPVWFSTSGDTGPEFWSIISGVYLGLSVFVWSVLVYPLKRLGKAGVIAINLPVSLMVYLLGVAIIGTLVANIFVVATANFSLYYSSLIGGLIVIFLVFADVAIRTE